jgi:hypothetical protein
MCKKKSVDFSYFLLIYAYFSLRLEAGGVAQMVEHFCGALFKLQYFLPTKDFRVLFWGLEM